MNTPFSFVQIAVGAKIFYAESIDKLIKNMNDCSPDIMTAVPKILSKFISKNIFNIQKKQQV
jgi:long-chain acyl-CoA synthetase